MLYRREILNRINKLKLPNEDYAVFGSTPLVIKEILQYTENDIDILARGKAWDKALLMTKKEDLFIDGIKTGERVNLKKEKIEIVNNWAPGSWDIDCLIDNADLFNNIRFVKIENILKYKLILNRKKDKEHVSAILNSDAI